MPWISGEHGGPGFYREPVFAMDDDSIDFGISRKREAMALREALVEAQKAIGRTDREGARYLGSMAAELMKEYRGWCYAIGRIAAAPPGDCRGLQCNPDLAPYADRAFGAIDLDWCERHNL